MNNNIKTGEVTLGVVGLGLMGTSVVTALLISGHRVKAIAPLVTDLQVVHERLMEQLQHCEKANLLSAPVDWYLKQLVISGDYSNLSNCKVVLECVVEQIEAKEAVYKKIADVVTCDTIIASNTSAIPISQLQRNVPFPERFLGIHWAEPAYLTRFLEITCGDKTSVRFATIVFNLAHQWGKEPTLLRKDIRGFVTNRLMYAVYREMFAIIGRGDATVEDVDKAFRYDAGSWMTLMGVFRRIDYMGLKDSMRVFNNILPTLNSDDDVPELMQEMVRNKCRGTQNGKGLYEYTPQEAKDWDEAFALFNQEIFELAARYPDGPGISRERDNQIE